MYMQGGELNVTSCEFFYNNAKVKGGALYLASFDDVIIDDCKFKENSANGNSGDDVVALGSSNRILISDSKFSNPEIILSVEVTQANLVAQKLDFRELSGFKSENG